MKKHWVSSFVACVVVSALGALASAAPVVNLSSDSTVVAGQASTALHFTVSGGAAVAGMGFSIEINSGHSGPTIISGDVLSGIFAGSNTGQQEPDAASIVSAGLGGYLARYVTVTQTGTVTATGALATINLNTTTLNPGDTFTIKLLGTDDGDTNFTDSTASPVETSFPTSVTITAVAAPEPASLGVLVLGAASLLMTRKRKN